MRHLTLVPLVGLLALGGSAAAPGDNREPAPGDGREPAAYARWTNGPGRDDSYFPIAVWLQSPHNAKRYQAVGINLYIGLWQGPTAEQLAALKAAGMPVICEQNELALRDANRDIIVGWMHGDEPDNAQSLGAGKGYGPPVDPARIVADYQRIAKADPTRPVFLNLGQGVAWDGWHGRGVRTNHPEDYPLYAKGGDILSFDIYPVTHDSDAVKGKLEFVPRGVDRLREAAQGGQIVWNCIECTRIGNPNVKPTPEQVRSMVWMSLIHGSRGLVYFSHQFAPNFIEAGLLADEAMLREVTAINRQVTELARVLNSPTVNDLATVRWADPRAPIDLLAKRCAQDGGGAQGTYVFACGMSGQPTTGTFTVRAPGAKRAVVLGEERSVPIVDGVFSDAFAGYGVHLYRLEE